MDFNGFNLKKELLQTLNELAFNEPTEVQVKALPLIFQGKDLIVRSQTGSGKTLTYALPVVQNIDGQNKDIQALVMCPTRELALQVTGEIKKLITKLPAVKVTTLYGGYSIAKQITALKKGVNIVVGTPGRIIDHLSRKTLNLKNVKMLILDEADEMLNMGFKDDVEKILKQTSSDRQTLMFSATFPPLIKKLSETYMSDSINVEVGLSNKSIANIQQHFVFINRNQKKESLKFLLSKYNPYSCIVFCNTKIMVDDIVSYLKTFKINAIALHGDIRQSQRQRIMASFKQGKENILVATDVAARGIDINNLDYIFNFDLPNNVEYYLHRIGRTARAGKSGNAITILNTSNQLQILKEFEKQTLSNITELELDETFKVKSSHAASDAYREKSFDKFKNKKFGKNDASKDNASKGKPYKSDAGKSKFNKSDASKDNASKGKFDKKDANKSKFEKRDFSKSKSSESRYSKSQFGKNDNGKDKSEKSQFGKNETRKSGFGKSGFSKNNSSKGELNKSDFGKNDESKNKSRKSGFSKSDFNKGKFGESDFSQKKFGKNNASKGKFVKSDANKSEYSKNDAAKSGFSQRKFSKNDAM